MKSLMNNNLIKTGLFSFALLLTLGCGKENKTTSAEVKDQPSAERFYTQFMFKRPVSVPTVGGMGTYLQSPVLPQKDTAGYAKANLFLIDDHTFVLEYNELVQSDPAKKDPFGRHHGIVIVGDWYVKDTLLQLTQGKNVIGEAKPHTTEEGTESLVLSLKKDLKAANAELRFIPKQFVLISKGSTRVLPHDLKKELAEQMEKIENTEVKFRD